MIFSKTENEKQTVYQGVSKSFSFIKCITNLKRSKSFFILFSVINLLLSLACIIIYIFMTYEPHLFMISNIYFTFVFVCSIYFLIDFLFDIVMSIIEKKIEVMNFLIEIISIFPFLIMRFIAGMHFDLVNNIDMICSSFICCRIYQISKFASFFKSDVNRELFNIFCSIISLLVMSSTIINVVENTQTIGKYWLFLPRDCSDSLNCNGNNDSFHSTFFFVMTTLATIGYYSSITSVLGRCFIIVLIILQVAEIPSMCGNLMAQLSSKSIYARMSYKQLDKVEFILISGNISYGSIVVLLQEYFHPDHGENERHALILMLQQPDSNMKRLMQKYQNKLFFFEGDPLKFNDLERCQFNNAKMIMLLCNKQTDDSSAEDSKTIIQAMAIKKHLAQLNENEKKNPLFSRTTLKVLPTIDNMIRDKEENELVLTNSNRLIIQLLRPESEHHFELSIAKNGHKDQILCIDELKLSLLAKSCLCKGIIALISNLIMTNNVVENNKNVAQILQRNSWMKEYTEGKDYEIYKISLDSKRGVSFDILAKKIYKKNQGIILFGLNIESKKTSNHIVLLSPIDFVLPEDDENIIIYGYLLAKNQSDANKVITNMQNDVDSIYEPIKFSDLNRIPLTIFPKYKLSNNPYSNQDEDDDDSQEQGNDKYITDRILLAQGYHVASELISKEAATCYSLQNKLIVKSGHIIICGICQNLIDFIKPLRAKNILKGDCPTIVVLSKELPDDKVWNTMAFFDELFLIQGDPMNKADLLRAGITTASKVVILAPSISEISTFTKNKIKADEKSTDNSSARKLTSYEEDLLDAKTIFKYNLISKLRKGIFCVIELINPKNVSFLSNHNRKNNDEYLFIKAGMDISLTASFASGEVYYSNMMDNLMSQTYYNPNLLSVLKKLIIGESENFMKRTDLKRYLNVPSGNLYLVDIPDYDSLFESNHSLLTFEIIFEKMLTQNKMIVIGVYKEYSLEDDTDEYKHINTNSSKPGSRRNSDKYSLNSNKYYYVVTSPRADFSLCSRDKLFVISPYYPNGNFTVVAKDDLIDNNDILQMEKNTYQVQDKTKRKEKKEIRREIDIEGERKLKNLNQTVIEIKNLLKSVKESIFKLSSEAKDKISENITQAINQILTENKLSNTNHS